MNDSQRGGGAAALVMAFIVVVVLVILPLLVGGGFIVYQRQRAAVLNMRAEAQLAAERMRVVAARQALAQQPGGQEVGLASEIVEEVLDAQRDAWNAGQIEEFMDYYWRSDELSFSSAGQVTRGWHATLDNYKVRYPSRQAMGQLSFDNLDIRLLGPDVAMVLGDWQLNRDPDPVGGNFTLILRKLDGRWLIVHDHTSRRDQQSAVSSKQ